MNLKEERERILKTLKNLKPLLKERYGVKSLAVFGSVVRGDFNEKSDVDILIELEKPIGLEFVELVEFLSKTLRRKVDLITPRMLKNPVVRKSVEEELTYV